MEGRYTLAMAIYEYYCPTCREQFQERRPMSEVAVAATCKKGHPAEKMISSFASWMAGSSSEAAFDMGEGGGCACGGACSCGGANAN